MKNYFITEIASAHMGKPSLVKLIANLHEKSKSNFIKFQIFKTINLFSKKNKNFKRFKRLEITFSKWEKLINIYMKRNDLILEPFDTESYNFCKKFKKYVSLKISSSESDNIKMINDAIKNFKKVFVNISGLDRHKISTLIKYIKGNKKKIIFMYGFQSYPTKKKNLRFDLFNFFKNKGFEYGYADHSKYGLNSNTINLCSHAIKINKCKYLEKHVCHNIKQKPNDYITSINIQDMDKFINMVRKSKKKIKFSKLKKISNDEKDYFLKFSKFAFAKEKISKNSKLKENKIKFLRSSSNYPGLTRLDFMENKKFILKNDIHKDEQLFLKNLS